ncbi:MAG: glycoside hydrolase family 130 protein [Bacteroidetes bacterium]|nr:glycoside hydrolase family 130 protein [Bacteroidota bacterium]
MTRADIPALNPQLTDVTSVFNPGAIRHGDEYILMLRVQDRGRETHLMAARSRDGIKFAVDRQEVRLEGIEMLDPVPHHIYDPRITFLEGAYYIMVAMDRAVDCVLGLIRTRDFQRFEFLGICSEPHFRNGVLFPEKIGGKYLRLERPSRADNAGVRSGDTIWLAESDDLLAWRSLGPVISGRPHYWDELIGSGTPPVRTRAGWLHLYHGIATHFASVNIYQAGAVLLDLNDPSRVIARSRMNILEPREPYELVGQVPNVVFPSGLVVDEFDAQGFALPNSRVLAYYGAADTCIGLATATISELIDACQEDR